MLNSTTKKFLNFCSSKDTGKRLDSHRKGNNSKSWFVSRVYKEVLELNTNKRQTNLTTTKKNDPKKVKQLTKESMCVCVCVYV